MKKYLIILLLISLNVFSMGAKKPKLELLPRVILTEKSCEVSYSSPFVTGTRLQCELFYRFPHKYDDANVVKTQQLKFFTNCKTCQEGAIKSLTPETPEDSPISRISGKKCQLGKIKWDAQYANHHSFWVKTLKDSFCSGGPCHIYYDTYFYFTSSLVEKNQTDACSK